MIPSNWNLKIDNHTTVDNVTKWYSLHDDADVVCLQVVTHTEKQLNVLVTNTSEHVDIGNHSSSQL